MQSLIIISSPSNDFTLKSIQGISIHIQFGFIWFKNKIKLKLKKHQNVKPTRTSKPASFIFNLSVRHSLIKVFHTWFCAITRIAIPHSNIPSESRQTKTMKRLKLYNFLFFNTKINISAKWHGNFFHNLQKSKCSWTYFKALSMY